MNRSTCPPTLALVFGLLLTLPAAAEDTATVPPPMPVAMLKAEARIDGKEVRLGDLFDNAGDHGGDVVAASPQPGQSMIFPTGWLVQAAQRAGLMWEPLSPYASIRVVRAAIEFDAARIGQALSGALGVAAPQNRVVVEGQPHLFAPTGGDPHLEIDRLAFDQAAGRFTADIRIDGDDASPSIHVAGTVEAMVELPVLTHALVPGEVIRPQDLTVSWQRADFVQSGEVMDSAALIGRTPRHPVRPNQTLRASDVEVPVVVKRNDRVLIVLEGPGMVLTAEGKALEDGGAGAVIRVANAQSNRPIQATVLAEGRVAAHMPEQIAAGL